MIFYYGLFFLVSLNALFYDFLLINKKLKWIKYYYTFIVINILIFFVGLRADGIDHDYISYINYFSQLKIDGYDNLSIFSKDVGFTYLYLIIIEFFGNDIYFLLFVAAISIIFKFFFALSIFNYKYVGLLLLLIFSRLYLIHDFTQIRVGLAISLGSYALLLLYNKRFFLGFCISLLSISIHLSVILLPILYIVYVLFFENKNKNKIIYIIIPILGIVLSGLSFSIVELLDFNRMIVYFYNDKNTGVSLFSFYYIIRITIYYCIVFLIFNYLSKIDRFLLYMLSCSLFLHAFLAFNDVFSLRTVEVLALFDMATLVVPLKYMKKRESIWYVCFLFSLSIIFFISSLKIVEPYMSYIHLWL